MVGSWRRTGKIWGVVSPIHIFLVFLTSRRGGRNGGGINIINIYRYARPDSCDGDSSNVVSNKIVTGVRSGAYRTLVVVRAGSRLISLRTTDRRAELLADFPIKTITQALLQFGGWALAER